MRTQQRYGDRAAAAVGGLIRRVESDGPADRGGLVAGDTVVSADGHALNDVLDWQWYASDAYVELSVMSADGGVRDVPLHRLMEEPWGLSFEVDLFDGVRTCVNSCSFCFMTQLPKGLRPALYVRDDDFRLSFLQGNFITLTNLSDSDVERIAEQHLSPLHVSLHAVDLDARAMLVHARTDRALERFDQLLESGIDLHVQIVLVPGVNDGAVLDETLRWLAEREGVLSIGVVPLGFTAHQSRFARSFDDRLSAGQVLDAIAPWQTAFRERDGIATVYAADELYLNAGRSVPGWSDYDGFPQYENGIGLVRAFIDEFHQEIAIRHEQVRIADGTDFALLSGALFAPLLETVLQETGLSGSVRCVGVENRFFGGNVAVTGLLVGEDMIASAAAMPENTTVLIPQVVFNTDGLTLDGLSIDDMSRAAGRSLRVVSCDAAGLVEALLGPADPENGTR